MKKIGYIILSLLVVISAYFTYIKADSLFFKSNKNNVKKDEVVYLTLDIKNIIYDKFNFTLSSSEDVHTLLTEDIEIKDIVNNEISFDIDKLSFEKDTITFSYKVNNTLNEGDTIVFVGTITNISDNEENTSMSEYITLTIEKEKSEENKDNNQNTNHNQIPSNNNKTTTKTKTTTRVSTSSFSKKTEVVTYNGSYNNYLNSLSVKGYKLNKTFEKEKQTYFVTVKNTTTKITINYKKSSSTSKVVITGNSGLKVGVNKVLVSVTAENGEVRVYRIYVTREGAE